MKATTTTTTTTPPTTSRNTCDTKRRRKRRRRPQQQQGAGDALSLLSPLPPLSTTSFLLVFLVFAAATTCHAFSPPQHHHHHNQRGGGGAEKVGRTVGNSRSISSRRLAEATTTTTTTRTNTIAAAAKDKNQNNNMKTTTNTNKRRKKAAPSKRTQLQWLLLSMKKLYKQQPLPLEQQQQEQRQLLLLQTIESFITAKTTSDVTQAGRTIIKLNLNNNCWYSSPAETTTHIQIIERVIKATAMVGLTQIALNLTQHLLSSRGHIPSAIAQDAICQSLRKVGKIQQIEQLLLEIGKVATTKATAREEQASNNGGLSQISYNIFLATLCDVIVDKTTDKSFWTPYKKNNPHEVLEEAISWLKRNKTTTLFGGSLQPNSISYSTVLNAATQVGNATLCQEIWDMALQHAKDDNNPLVMKTQLFNARMKSLQQTNSNDNDDAILQLWEQMQQSTATAQPDRYTIDLLLVPLLRKGLIGEMTKLLDQFVTSPLYSASMKAEAFQAFLWTLASKGNDVATAKAIFDLYIAPSFSPVLNSSMQDKSSSMQLQRLVRPRTRHFTTLIEGHRKQIDEINDNNNYYFFNNKNSTTITSNSSSSSSTTVDSSKDDDDIDDDATTKRAQEEELEELRQEAWKLYNLLVSSPSIKPDEYTLTAMMGICSNSEELTHLLDQAMYKLEITNITGGGAVLRAAITAYGEVLDPSSSCSLFLHNMNMMSGKEGTEEDLVKKKKAASPPPNSSSSISTRYWNVLLGALTKQQQQQQQQQREDQEDQEDNANKTSIAITTPTLLPVSPILDVTNAKVNRILPIVNSHHHHHGNTTTTSSAALPSPSLLDGLTCWEAVEFIVSRYIDQPNAQTYCLLAKAAQQQQQHYNNNSPSSTAAAASTAMAIFRNATAAGIPADGRFVNAVIRCFGNDIDSAINYWRSEIRQSCLCHENRRRSKPVPAARIKGKNLLAAYHGLLFVSGRAIRPDIALRIVKAMSKFENLEADETALNCYKAGKRLQLQLEQQQQPQGNINANANDAATEDTTIITTTATTTTKTGLGGDLKQRFQKLLSLNTPNMIDAYESLLFVECVKYDQRDKRRSGEKRIRIII